MQKEGGCTLNSFCFAYALKKERKTRFVSATLTIDRLRRLN
jgi:hypothetical protein